MPKVTSATAEIEFVAGTWTDVSADVDWAAGWSFQVGRTTPQGVAQTSTLALTLYNAKGKYTPGLQTLSDGTAAPYYPNVLTRKRLRVSINGNVRWLGFVKGWYPQMVNGVIGKVVVQAADRMDALSRVLLRHPYLQEHLSQAATAGGTSLLYLMNDHLPTNYTTGTLTEYNRAASPFVFLSYVGPNQTGSTDAPMPAADGLTGLACTNGLISFNNQTLRSGFAGDFLVSAWVTLPILNSGNSLASGVFSGFLHQLLSPSGSTADPEVQLQIKYAPTPATTNLPVNLLISNTTYSNITGTGPVDDGLPHHYAVLATTSAGVQTLRLYCDGVQVGSAVTGAAGQLSGVGANVITLINASTDSGFTSLAVNVGPISYYWGGTYSVAIVQALYAAGTGYAGDTTSAREARILAYAGLSAGDYSLDTGVARMGPQPLNGVDVVTASQATSSTEGGGSAVYVNAGTVVFKSRTARKPGAPTLTLDAVRDLTREVWQPSHDDTTQINQVIVNRADDAGTVSTQAIDKSAGGPVINTDVTTYASTDADALNLAQDVIAQNFTPGFRLSQVAVDLVTAENNLYASAFAVGIGSRLRVTAIPAGVTPATQVDSLVEGWREEYSVNGGVEVYQFTFDTSPADSPAWMVWDDASYGRWQATGCTLNAGITNSATTVVIATTAGKPTFTTNAAMYPLKVAIAGEHIQLNSAPSGSTSPQTFTGVTRGVDGTTAAAQAGGAAVDLAPTSTWTL